MRAQPRRPRSPSNRAIAATPEARRYPPEGTPQPASARKPTDRTSKSAVPIIDPTCRRHGCNGPHRPTPSRSPHGYERCILPMDAKDREPYAPRSYGRSVVALYNTARPHSGLGNLTPAIYAELSAPGKQRANQAPITLGLYSSADKTCGSGQDDNAPLSLACLAKATQRGPIGLVGRFHGYHMPTKPKCGRCPVGCRLGKDWRDSSHMIGFMESVV
jgi:hypothetical protein